MDINSLIVAKEAEKIYMNVIYPLSISAALKDVARKFSERSRKEDDLEKVIKGIVC